VTARDAIKKLGNMFTNFVREKASLLPQQTLCRLRNETLHGSHRKATKFCWIWAQLITWSFDFFSC